MERPSGLASCLACTAIFGAVLAANLLNAEEPPQDQPSSAGALGALKPVDSETGLPLMPASEAKAGMKGYGLTSLQGVAPQRFDVEVLGVIRGAFAKGDIVLIKMSGPVIDETGVIAGMSGSPVYIDGRLLGAVAYGWRYCKVPLAGVTPAEEMMQVRRVESKATAGERAEAKAQAREALRARGRDLARVLTTRELTPEVRLHARRVMVQMAAPASLGPEAFAQDAESFPAAVRDLLPAGAGPAIEPLPIPLSVRGPASAGGSVVPLLDGSGFIPVQAAGRAASPAAQEVKLEPGMPVGAAFVTGDMDVSGMGTLTWTDGQTALAFGHPMFGSGETDLPMAVGEVQAVVPSLLRSFKLTNTGRVIGRITQDRQSAVVGRLGQEAPTFPCKVRVTGAVNQEYNYRVAGHWDVAPTFAFTTVAESSTRWEGEGNRNTLTAKAQIALRGRKEPLVLQNVYTSYSVVWPGFDLVLMPLDALLLNPYRDVEIESVTYELEVKPGFEAALIESAWSDRTQVKPGAELAIYVRLMLYRGEHVVQKLKFRMPDTAKPDTYVEILLCDAAVNRLIKWSLDPGLFAPRSLDGLLSALQEMESNKLLIMRASVAEQGVRYDGEAMAALPPSALSILEHNETAGLSSPLVTDIVQKVETPWVLEGAQTIRVLVQKPDPHRP